MMRSRIASVTACRSGVCTSPSVGALWVVIVSILPATGRRRLRGRGRGELRVAGRCPPGRLLDLACCSLYTVDTYRSSTSPVMKGENMRKHRVLALVLPFALALAACGG